MGITKTQLNGWKETTLGDLIASGEYEIRNNLRLPLSSEQRLKIQGQYPYYGAAGAIDSINKYQFEGSHLLVAEDGTVADGRSPMLQLVDGKFWVSNHAHIIRGKDRQSTRRLYYFLRNVDINPYITGAVQPKLSKENLFRILFLYPKDESEKQEVVAVLSSLDDKIELLRRQNETLEAMARAIFHEWFVAFNFPNEQGKPYKKSGGTMVESELGEIPEGWSVRNLGDIADIIDCLHSKKPERVLENTGKTLLQLENIRDNGLLDISERYFISNEDYAKWISRIEANEGDCVITNVGRVGVVSRIPTGVRAALGRNMTAVRVKLSYPYPYFLIGYLTSQTYKAEMSRKTDAGTILNALNVRNISKLRLVMPESFDLLNACNQVIASLWQKMEANISHTNQLSGVRDALLPKLMSGEVRVKI